MIHRQAELPSLNGNPRKQLPSLPVADSASRLESFLGEIAFPLAAAARWESQPNEKK